MSDTTVESVASDPVESSSLPAEAKEFIRSQDAEETAPETGEAAAPAETKPAVELEAKPVPVPAKLSDDQRRLVKESHLSEEDVADLSPEQVDKFLSVIKKRDDRLIRRAQTMQRVRDEQGRFKSAPAPEAKPAEAPAQRQLVKGVSEGGEYDDDIAKIINAQFAEIDALKKHVEDFNQFKTAQTQQWEAREIEQRNAWFDDQFSKLGDAFHPVFGKGTIRELLPESAEFKSRDEVASMFHMQQRLYPNANPDELFQKAAKACYPDIYINQQKAELAKQVQSQSARRLGAGSASRQSITEPPDEDAYLEPIFKKMLAENGSR